MLPEKDSGSGLDTIGWGAEVNKIYQVMGIPSYYLVDSQGLIVERLRIRDIDEIVATMEKSL